MFTADFALIQIWQLEHFNDICLHFSPTVSVWPDMKVDPFIDRYLHLICGHGKQAGANRGMRQKNICKTGNNHWSRVKLLWQSIHVKHTESKNGRRRHVRLVSHGSAWQANEPGSQREGQTTTRGSLCCPTCPEVLLLCSNPHPITLSTWRRSLIISE